MHAPLPPHATGHAWRTENHLRPGPRNLVASMDIVGRAALLGLRVGNAVSRWLTRTPANGLVPTTHRYSSSTVQAHVLLQHLEARREVFTDAFVHDLARAYMADPREGYGRKARRLLARVAEGASWRRAARRGSQSAAAGLEAASRAPIVGAFFHDDLDQVALQAGRATRVTHGEDDGIAGAVAVATTAALFARDAVSPSTVWRQLLARTPMGAVRRRIRVASRLGEAVEPADAASMLLRDGGTADGIAFATWCAVRHPDDYAVAVQAATAAGDQATPIGAIVGGVVGVRAWPPTPWVRATESL